MSGATSHSLEKVEPVCSMHYAHQNSVSGLLI
ncbi:hypothetical protein THAOC_00040, partial [Thalassiosira oceanica]